MIKYTCIDKETKKVEYFISAYDRFLKVYRLINLTTGEIEVAHFESLSHALAILEVPYDIKMKSEI